MSCGCKSQPVTTFAFAPEEDPAPTPVSQASVLPPVRAPVSTPSDPLIQFKIGVRAPPQMTAQTLQALEALRTAHRLAGAPLVTVTSWYRDASENLQLPGAVSNSLHLQGLAFDLRADAGGAAVYQAWLGLGLQGKDERNIPGVAPHWHIELQRRV